MPLLVSPMQVSTGSGQPPTGPEWVVELAWTGHRCIAYVEPGRTRLLSAADVTVTAAYPELAAPLQARCPPGGMVLDGTIVARGEEHAARPRQLLRRSSRRHPSEQHIRDVPVDFQIADLLFLDGLSTVELPYRDRRALLDGLGFDDAPVWTTSPLPVSELDSMLRIAEAKGVEALHARHLGSRYRPGGRSPLWLKVPVPRTRQVVVGGWTATDPAHPDTIASLLVGVPDGTGGLRYVGRVGVAGEHRRQITALRPLSARVSPFAGPVPGDVARRAIWVAPRLVGLVEFTGFFADGRLRLPHWRGIAPKLADLTDPDPARWARPAEPPPRRTDVPAPPIPAPLPPVALPEDPPAAPDPQESPPPATAAQPAGEVARRLEQHFVYNALNTIAALIRTDPGRARELLFGFAELSRAADQPSTISTSLGKELETVRGYLQLEQARFGKRLHVEIAVDAALHHVLIPPLQLLGIVRDAVQRDIEPRPEGGVLTVSAVGVEGGCAVTVTGGAAEPVVLRLPATGAAVPS